MTRTQQEREILNAARLIKRKEGRERRTRKKKQNSKPSRGRERDPGFLAYLRRQPCEARHIGGCEGAIQAAHVRYSDSRYAINPGMGRKNHDRHANPLCRFHHLDDQHKRNEQAFWAKLGKNAYETAAMHYAAYRSEA